MPLKPPANAAGRHEFPVLAWDDQGDNIRVVGIDVVETNGMPTLTPAERRPAWLEYAESQVHVGAKSKKTITFSIPRGLVPTTAAEHKVKVEITDDKSDPVSKVFRLAFVNLQPAAGFIARWKAELNPEADGAHVATFLDVGGSNYHAVENGTTWTGPTMRRGVLGGRAALEFTGSRLKIPDPVGIQMKKRGTTWIALYKIKTGNGTSAVMESNDGNGPNYALGMQYGGRRTMCLFDPDGIPAGGSEQINLPGTSTDGTWHAVAMRSNADGSVDIFVNGLRVGKNRIWTWKNGGTGISSAWFGYTFQNGAEGLHGYIAEAFVYPTALSDADLAQTFKYFGAEYGIPIFDFIDWAGLVAKVSPYVVLAPEGLTGLADGASVEIWNDLSGRNMHATHAGAGTTTYRASTVGGGPSVEFAGGGYLALPNSAFPAGDTEFSVVSAYLRGLSVSGRLTIVAGGTGGSGQGWSQSLERFGSSQDLSYAYGSHVLTTGTLLDGIHTIGGKVHGMTMRYDKGYNELLNSWALTSHDDFATSATAVNYTNTNNYVGAAMRSTGTVGNFMSGHIIGVVVLPKVHPAVQAWCQRQLVLGRGSDLR